MPKLYSELLDKAFGDYYYAPPTTLLTGKQQQSSGCTPELIPCKGARIVQIAETDNADILNCGTIKKITAGYIALIREAVAEVNRLQGKIERILDGKIEIPDIAIPQNPMAGDLVLSKEAVSQAVKTIRDGAASKSFAKALEIG